MGFFYRPAGGGDQNLPTYDGSDVTVLGSVDTTNIVLTNSGTTPIAVELSFSSLTGGQTYLKGTGFDQGTATSPTYSIDPDTGSRTITLTRGDRTQTYSGGDVSETVTLTSNGGQLPTAIQYTVKPRILIGPLVAELFAAPTIEYKFENNALSTGSRSGYDLTTVNLDIANSTDYTWALGEALADENSSRGYTSSAKPRTEYTRNEDRTWILIWKNVTVPANLKYTLVGDGNDDGAGAGWLRSNAGLYEVESYPSPTFVRKLSAANGTAYPSGTPSDLRTNAGDLNIYCASYDLSSTTLSYMWKSSNQATGQHTYYDVSQAALSGSGSATYFGVGGSSGSNSSNDLKFYYAAVLDRVTTKAEFQSLLDALGV